jgi:hypothetical protein
VSARHSGKAKKTYQVEADVLEAIQVTITGAQQPAVRQSLVICKRGVVVATDVHGVIVVSIAGAIDWAVDLVE